VFLKTLCPTLSPFTGRERFNPEECYLEVSLLLQFPKFRNDQLRDIVQWDVFNAYLKISTLV
jgi:hypothetical protein